MVEQLTDLSKVDRNLFPGSLTIRALRDSRYHNTAYAVAELIDNSIEADAGRIELLCQEQHTQMEIQQRGRLSEIAVLDNGEGMSVETLLGALKFGGGTRHESRRGIGKYGMGLPTSSMSQCKRVDVWTWQNGPNTIWHSSIDADEIEQGNHFVPIPDQTTSVPDIWKRAGSQEIFENKSGTLIVWTKLDKIQWKTGRTLIKNTAMEVGRIHRQRINNDSVRIDTIAFLKNRPESPSIREQIIANDPLYLMKHTSTPETPWDKKPMFKQYGEIQRYPYTIDGREETIEVQYSIVKPKALRTKLATQNPGTTDRGQHARHNIGVSVVREGREIILEDAFLREGGSSENPRNRWWGCQVSFSRGCDELFGVDHNKQMVSNFTQAAKTLARDDRPNQKILEEMGIERDIIYDIVGDIRDRTRAMMREIGQMFEQKRSLQNKSKKRSPEKEAAKTATVADRDAIAGGTEQPTSTDKERETKSPKERREGLVQWFIDEGQTSDDAQQLARTLIDEDLSYQFNPAQLDGYLMFNVRSNQGILHINLNTDHPVYDLLKHIEDDLDENANEENPAFLASVAIRLLLSSWARMEDQTESRDERTRIQDISTNWGRQVHKVISRLRERDD